MTQKRGFAVWLTGLPASGKSTLAVALAEELAKLGVNVQILDSDDLRECLTPQPTYNREERDWFYRVMIHIGSLLTQNGVNVIFAATANRRYHRAWARRELNKFMEVYLKCPLEVCMERDDKEIYTKALAGEATTVPGLQDPYELSESPELTVETDKMSPHECAQQIVDRMKKLSFLTKEVK